MKHRVHINLELALNGRQKCIWDTDGMYGLGIAFNSAYGLGVFR
jgi:hypothetical protein